MIRDAHGRVLVVEPTYKSTWEIPGGAVEADESPRMACQREIAEELGLELVVGRLLCIEWQGPELDRTESFMFIFDGGFLGAQVIRLATDELASYAFVGTEQLDSYLIPRLARRVRSALLAADEGRLVEMEHGSLVLAVPTVLE